MMNAQRSSKFKLTRYAFLIPVIAVLLLVFSFSKAKTLPAGIQKQLTTPIEKINAYKEKLAKNLIPVDTTTNNNTKRTIPLPVDTVGNDTDPGDGQSKIPAPATVSATTSKPAEIHLKSYVVKPEMYYVDGLLTQAYDVKTVDASSVSQVGLGEGSNGQKIVFITTKNGAGQKAITNIRIDGKPARILKGHIIDGKIMVLDTQRNGNKMVLDTIYIADRAKNTYKPSSTFPSINQPGTQTDGIITSARDSAVINKSTGVTKLYGSASLTYKGTRVTAQYIECDKKTHVVIARGDVKVVTKTDKGETSTAEAQDFTWYMNKNYKP